MNIREIINKHLKENGFDGLSNFTHGCSCLRDNLFSCSSEKFGRIQNCKPSHFELEEDDMNKYKICFKNAGGNKAFCIMRADNINELVKKFEGIHKKIKIEEIINL